MLLTRVAALAASVLAVAVLLDAWRIASTVRDQPLKLDVAGLAPGDRFGASIALDGDWLAVGAPGDDDASKDAGAVYTFRRAGLRWTPAGTLRAAGAQSTYELGRVVALSAQRLAISALEPGRDASRGVVFVFAAPTQSSESWNRESVLTSPGGASNDKFGCALALEGDTLLVGASDESEHGGVVHVFTRRDGSWEHAEILAASEPHSQSRFGATVALDGATAIVGAPGHEPNGQRQCAAYVFERGAQNGWSEVGRLTSREQTATEEFGAAVAIRGDVALVGAPWVSPKNQEALAVCIFKRSREGGTRWNEVARLRLPSIGPLGGSELAVSNGRALIGCSSDEEVSGAGSVFMFGESDSPPAWSQLRKLTDPNAKDWGFFGTSIAADGRTLVIGAPGGPEEIGAVYVAEIGRARFSPR